MQKWGKYIYHETAVCMQALDSGNILIFFRLGKLIRSQVIELL